MPCALIISYFTFDIYYGLTVLMFLLFSFSFNDYIDADKDLLGHPERALPSGKITKSISLTVTLTLLIFGLAWSHVYAHQFLTGIITAYIFSISYSLFFKPILPVLGTFVWSSAIAILFVQPFTESPSVYIGIGALVYGYECLLDYRDRNADKTFCKTPTLAYLLGKYIYIVSLISIAVGLCIVVNNI